MIDNEKKTSKIITYFYRYDFLEDMYQEKSWPQWVLNIYIISKEVVQRTKNRKKDKNNGRKNTNNKTKKITRDK